MNLAPEFVDAVKTPGGPGRAAGDMIAVVGKLFPGSEAGRFADDFFPFDDQVGSIEVLDHPFSAEERKRVFRSVVNRNEVDESVRLIGGQTRAAMVVDEFIQAGGKAGRS